MARKRKNSPLDAAWSEMSPPRRHLQSVTGYAAVYLFIAFLFLMNLIALPVPYLGLVKAQFFLMAIYYWSIYRPTLLPTWLCFGLGLVLDAVMGMPLGMQSLAFVLVHGIVRDQRRFLTGQNYISVWAAFVLVVLAATLLQWMLYGFVNGRVWTAPVSLTANIVMTLFLFPAVSLGLTATHRMLPVATRP